MVLMVGSTQVITFSIKDSRISSQRFWFFVQFIVVVVVFVCLFVCLFFASWLENFRTSIGFQVQYPTDVWKTDQGSRFYLFLNFFLMVTDIAHGSSCARDRSFSNVRSFNPKLLQSDP